MSWFIPHLPNVQHLHGAKILHPKAHAGNNVADGNWWAAQTSHSIRYHQSISYTNIPCEIDSLLQSSKLKFQE